MKHNWHVTIAMVSLFFASQLVGLAIINSYVDVARTVETGKIEWKPLPDVAGYKLDRPQVAPTTSVVYILLVLLISTVLVLLIARWRQVFFWKLWFWLAVVLCLHVALAAFLPSMYAFVTALILGSLKVFKPGVVVHNVTELLVYGGLAAVFVPLLSVVTGVVLLLLVSAYDAYAVWRSLHMVSLARFQARSGIFAGFLLPYTPERMVLARPKRMLSRLKTGRGVLRTAILGGGDVGFPLLFAGAVMKEAGVQSAILVSLGATAALFALLFFGRREKFYPAMPFITLGCLAGWLFGLVL